MRNRDRFPGHGGEWSKLRGKFVGRPGDFIRRSAECSIAGGESVARRGEVWRFDQHFFAGWGEWVGIGRKSERFFAELVSVFGELVSPRAELVCLFAELGSVCAELRSVCAELVSLRAALGGFFAELGSFRAELGTGPEVVGFLPELP